METLSAQNNTESPDPQVDQRIPSPSSVPPMLARFADRAFHALGHLQTHMLPPEAIIMNHLNSFVLPRCIWVAAELGIADHLVASSRHIDDLAAVVGANADALYRVMRFLSSAGIFDEKKGKHFAINGLAECLRSDSPTSMRNWARYVGAPWYWNDWASLLGAVQNGRTVHENAEGMSFFDYYTKHGYTSTFDAGMSSVSSLANPAIAASYEFSRLNSVVDIAGGQGALLATILKANSGLRGILFERAEIVEVSRRGGVLSQFGDRVAFEAGSIFESIPSGHDGYLMKWILHDWSDGEVTTILRNIRRAAAPDATLLVAEMVVESNNPAAMLLDIGMLALTGGRERTINEYRSLFSDSGFELRRVRPTASPYSLLEAVAV
jgi:hypothetical protein